MLKLHINTHTSYIVVESCFGRIGAGILKLKRPTWMERVAGYFWIWREFLGQMEWLLITKVNYFEKAEFCSLTLFRHAIIYVSSILCGQLE